MAKAPQNSTIEVVFKNIRMGTNDNLPIEDVEDITLSISKGSVFSNPISILKRSEKPGKFIINEDGGVDVSVIIDPEDLNNGYGVHFLNLYVMAEGRQITHITRKLTIDPTVKAG